jgi:hypothetical protein
MTGFLLEGLTPTTLAKKLVEVGEGWNVLHELSKLMGGMFAPLTIEIDATAVQEAIDKELRDLGVLGEVAKIKVPEELLGPQFLSGTVNELLSYFHDKPDSYRALLLLLAAQCIHIVKELDNEQRG